jgi:hypothetical protein
MNKATWLCLIPIVVAVFAICMLYNVASSDYLPSENLVSVDLINSFNNDSNDGSIASRWNVEARTFNPVGKPHIYDTVKRSGVNVTLQNWTLESGSKVLSEINALKGE